MKWLVTGGAGFIGCNAAMRMLIRGDRVIIFDNLSRRGAEENLEWLRHRLQVEFFKGDVRAFSDLERVFRSNPDIDVVLHLAAQVAVTRSIVDPRHDFEANAMGTFNVCEAVRQFAPAAILLNASTNKVYGATTKLKIVERDGRYEYVDLPRGVSEDYPLDFHSPYGCSKGVADQYVRDYARIYGLRTVNFRQSCVYGPRQFGIEDQGWVAWFAIAAVLERPITIYGDGRQVRDLLFIDDLIECYFKAVASINKASGHSYNIGGGPLNTASVLELLDLLEHLSGRKIRRRFAEWRPADQRVFFCDITKAKKELDWEPKLSRHDGIRKLVDWVVENRTLFRERL